MNNISLVFPEPTYINFYKDYQEYLRFNDEGILICNIDNFPNFTSSDFSEVLYEILLPYKNEKFTIKIHNNILLTIEDEILTFHTIHLFQNFSYWVAVETLRLWRGESDK